MGSVRQGLIQGMIEMFKGCPYRVAFFIINNNKIYGFQSNHSSMANKKIEMGTKKPIKCLYE